MKAIKAIIGGTGHPPVKTVQKHPMKLVRSLVLAALVAAPVFGPAARAVVTQKQTDDTFAAFSSGEFTNVSLSNDGRLGLAPGITNLTGVDDSIIWSMVQDKKGDLYFATGDRGKVYKLTPKGDLSTFFEPNAVMVHALAIDRKGRLYAATSPDGCVYRLDPDGRAEVYCNPGETYVWAMVFGGDGSLYLATGDNGKILRVPPSRKTPIQAETYFETGEANITALAWDNDGNLLAGSSPHGYLYRIEKTKDGHAHGFVVFNSGDREIKQIAPAPNGVIYVSTFIANPKPEGPSAQTPITIAISPTAGGGLGESATGTVIRAANGHLQPRLKSSGAGVEVLPGGASGDPNADDSGDPGDDNDDPANQASILSLINGDEEGSGSGNSLGAIYRIDTNGFCDHYWSVPGEAIYSLTLLPDGTLLAGTGNKGRIYSISDASHWKLLQETGDGSQLAALLPDLRDPKTLYAATSHPANIYRLDFSLAGGGTFTSKTFDTKQKSQWGKLHPFGEVPAGTQLEFSTRSGNTPEPKETWSVWSKPAPMGPEIAVTSPDARYLQYRVEFKRSAGSPGDSARLSRLVFYYQNLNAPPVISRIKVHNEGFSVTRMPMPDMGAQPASLNDLLGGNEDSQSGEEVIISMMPEPPLKMNKIPGYCTVVWRARDPNGDQLNYSVAIRSESDTNWTILKHKTQDAFYSFDTKGFPEGLYVIRVRASDLPSNTPGTALTAEAVSEPFLINNAPPVITVQSQSIERDHAVIVVKAADAASVITSASYSLDGKDDVALRPDDLIFDSMDETFTIRLADLGPGVHSLMVQAQDDANNKGALQLDLEVK